MPSVNTKKSIVLEGYTDASIKYGIQNHRYDRVKYSFIETDFIFSTFHLISTLLQLTLACLSSVFMGVSLVFALFHCPFSLLLGISILFSYGGFDFFLIALERGLELFIPWLLSTPGLYLLAGAVLILSIFNFFAILDDTPMITSNICAIPACLYQIAIFPFATAFNLFSLINNAIYSSAYDLMDDSESRPAHECLIEYLNEHLEIKHICLDLEFENQLDLKQLRHVIALIPHSVDTIELCAPFGPSYYEETPVALFEALNSVNREKIVFNTQVLTDKWDAWQNAQTFYALEQTSVPVGRPRLNQDVIRFGIFSYLEPSDMHAMFDVLCPQVYSSTPS